MGIYVGFLCFGDGLLTRNSFYESSGETSDGFVAKCEKWDNVALRNRIRHRYRVSTGCVRPFL